MKDTQKKRILSKLQSEIEALVSLTEEFCHQDVSVHEMEKSLFKHLLLIGYMLLVFVLEQKIIQKKNKRPQSQEGEKIEKKGFQRRKYLSLFGMIVINRPSYWSKLRGKLYVLDEDMDLPKDSWSYNIQEMVGENASENDFRESVRLLNKLLGLNLSGKASERNAGRLGKEVGAYYDSKAIKTQDQALCFSASFDGKGVPKIKPAKPQSGNPKKRLGKGEKKGIM